MPAGTLALAGTEPTCTVVTEDVEFHCVLAKRARRPRCRDWKGTVEPTVDATKHVNGGCRSLASDGTEWQCYLGQEAVDQQIIGQQFLGEYSRARRGLTFGRRRTGATLTGSASTTEDAPALRTAAVTAVRAIGVRRWMRSPSASHASRQSSTPSTYTARICPRFVRSSQLSKRGCSMWARYDATARARSAELPSFAVARLASGRCRLT